MIRLRSLGLVLSLEENIQEIEQGLDFYYATLGYTVTEQLLIYGSYWLLDSHSAILAPENARIEDDDVEVFTLGTSHDLTDRIRLKAQFSRVKDEDILRLLSQDVVISESDDF